MRQFKLSLIGPQYDCCDAETVGFLREVRDEDPEDKLLPVNAVNADICSRWVQSVKDKNRLIAEIDPWSPLDPQFDAIKETVKMYLADEVDRLRILREDLGSERRRGKRVISSKYPLYLRLLDARDKSVAELPTWPKIVEQLETEGFGFEVDIHSVPRMYRAAIAVQNNLINK
jgi:hypothetical protein